jgi:rhodanese-related sulfurtransferase
MWVAGAVVAWLLLKQLIGGGKVSSSVVTEKIKAGAKVVDVRSPDEFRDGSYPGAVNIPVGSLAGRLGEIPKDRPVVLFCASGARSAAAARMLRQAGYADVVNAGGLGDMPA